MRRNLSGLIIIFFITALSFTILLYGINMVSNNMNSLYSSSQNSYSIYKEGNSVIPEFISFQQTKPYVFELTVMGSGYRINFNELIDNVIYLKDWISYLIMRNI